MQHFEKIPIVCYINFLAEFHAANTGMTRAEAIAAWKELKKLDVPKDYASWDKARAKRKGKKK
jgi:hypothetical protein